MTASDQGVPPKTAVVDVEVNVLRNQYGPRFTNTTYEVTVDEKRAYGTGILTVAAVDRDQERQPGVSHHII